MLLICHVDTILMRQCMHSFTQKLFRRWWQIFCSAVQKKITELVTTR